MAGTFSGGFAGGLAEGLNGARQSAIDLAHMKMQQQLNQFQMDKFNQAEAVKPIDEMINKMPYAGEELLPLRDEAMKRAQSPAYAASTTYQPNARVGSDTVPQAIPNDYNNPEIDPNILKRMMDSADERDIPPPEMPTLKGDAAWTAKLTDTGRAARQADLERQINVNAISLRKALELYNYKANDKSERIPGDAEARARGALLGRNSPDQNGVPLSTTDAYNRGRGSGQAATDSLQLRIPVLGAKQDQEERIRTYYAGPKAAATAAGSGRAVIPGGVTLPPPYQPGVPVQIPPSTPTPAPGPAPVDNASVSTAPPAPAPVQPPPTRGTLPQTQPGQTQRVPNGKQQETLSAMDAAVAQAEEFAKSTQNVPAGPLGMDPTGWGMETWTKAASRDPTGLLKTIDPDANRRATFYQESLQNALANLRSIFGARITNMDMIFGKDIEPQPGDNLETLQRKANQMTARAKAAASLYRQSLQGMNVAAGADGKITIPQHLIPGLTFGDQGPAGDFRPTNLPPGYQATPQAPAEPRIITPKDIQQYRRRSL
jgi:hypothetical protein